MNRSARIVGHCIVFKWNTATLAWGSFLMARCSDWWHQKSENVNLWCVDDIILKDKVETPYSLSQIKTHHSRPTLRYTQEPGAPGSVPISRSARVAGHCIVFKWNTATLAWGGFLMARCSWWHLAWDQALSLLSLYVSHGKRAWYISLSDHM